MVAAWLYLTAAAFGIVAGILFALCWADVRVASTGLAGCAVTSAAVYVSILTGPNAPGSGPVFGLATLASLFLVSPAVRAGRPGLEGLRYWRRMWRILRYDDGRESRL